MATIRIPELVRFLLEAIPATYAGEGEEVNPWTPAFKELEYPEDGWPEAEWYYCDSYQGFYQAPGRELVYYRGQPVWCRVYHGGMLAVHRGDEALAKATFAFLKSVLRKIDIQRPYWRGPSELVEGDWQYKSSLDGDIRSFNAIEIIRYQDEVVFRQWYGGGLIITKDMVVASS